MCGAPVWGIAGLVMSGYFSYRAYAHVARGQLNWPYDAWTALTYAVWILLIAGLMSETRCWRERLFFILVLANFSMGFVLSIRGGSQQIVRDVRLISAVLWGLAALVSLAITFSSGKDGVEQGANV